MYTIEGDKIERYNLDERTFEHWGVLECETKKPATDGYELKPHSIAIDRRGMATVAYTSGELFTVDLKVATLPCRPAAAGDVTVGSLAMVPDSNGNEALYGTTAFLEWLTAEQTALARFDKSKGFVEVAKIATAGFGDLGGIDQESLWGYFSTQTEAYLAVVSTEDGTLGRTIRLPKSLTYPFAWEFVVVRGAGWLFLMDLAGAHDRTSLQRIDLSSGAVEAIWSEQETDRAIYVAGAASGCDL